MSMKKYGVKQDLNDKQKRLLKKLSKKRDNGEELDDADKEFLKRHEKEASNLTQEGNVLKKDDEGTKPFEG